MPKRWYVVRTLPNAEPAALAQIEARGFDAFMPRTTLVLPPWTRSGARRRPGDTIRQIPMFPGYIMIFFDIANPPDQFPTPGAWQRIAKLEGINGFLPHGHERPDPINPTYEAFIYDLRESTQNGKLSREEALDLATKYLPGQAVPIIAGLFEGQAGTFLSKYRTAGDLFLMLQTPSGTIKVPADCVPPAPAPLAAGVRRYPRAL